MEAEDYSYKSTLAEKHLCYHCGALVPEARLSDREESKEGLFCCSGCEIVYRTIRELKLEDFYRYQGNSGAPVTFVPGTSRYAFLDHPEFVHSHVTSIDEDLRSASFILTGIHCAGCIWLIEGLPKILRGVVKSAANVGTGVVTVLYRPTEVRLGDIARTLDSLGYQVRPDGSRGEDVEKAESRWMLVRLGVAAFCALNSMMLAVSLYQGMISGIEAEYGNLLRWGSFLLSLPAVFFSAIPFYRNAIFALRVRRLHIDLPISIAIVGAFFFSVFNTYIGHQNVYFDSVTTLIALLLCGRVLQAKALRRARFESRLAWDLLPGFVERIEEGGKQEIPVSEVRVGDVLHVGSGERVPVDGHVLKGASSLDRSVITGESLPVEVLEGDEVLAGSLNVEAPFDIEVDKVQSETRLGRILREIDSRWAAKPRIVQLADRASGYFVVGVLCLSIVTIFVWLPVSVFSAVDNTVALLIVTCPCALGLATPLALATAIGRAARGGILIKDADTIERVARSRRIFFDKTGTLSSGLFSVVDHFGGALDLETGEVLRTLAEVGVRHPISRAILSTVSENNRRDLLALKSVPGKGVQGVTSSGRLWCLGSVRWAEERGIDFNRELTSRINQWSEKSYSIALLTKDENVLAAYALRDGVKPGVRELISTLCSSGHSITLISGDHPKSVIQFGASIGLSPFQCRGGLYPEDKAQILRDAGPGSCMIGDGVNDCLAMKEADVAIGVRGGVEISLEVSDLYILNPTATQIAEVFRGAERTMGVIRRNLIFSVFYNLCGAGAAVLGYVNPIFAAFLMPISSLTVIGSSILSKSFLERD